MNKIYNEINKRTNGRYADVRFASVRFSAGAATVTVLCPADRVAELKGSTELYTAVADVCNFHSRVEIEVAAYDDSPSLLLKRVREFAVQFPYVSSAVSDMTVDSAASLRFKMHASMYGLAKTDFLPRLDEYLSNLYQSKIQVIVDVVDFVPTSQEAAPKKPEKIVTHPTYEIKSLKPVVGEIPTDGDILSAAKVEGNIDDVKACGIMTMVTEMTSKGSGAKRSRPYEKFLLYDGEHTLQCRYFPHNGVSLYACDVRNRPVCVFGNAAVERGRIGETSMTVNSLALCEADGLNLIAAVPPPEKYRFVAPTPYEEYVQVTLFGGDDELPESLKGVYVAFDFETTGLSVVYDSPTELGAVKIVDGVITETFHTMIDPLRPIPEEVTKKTGITDEMVKGQPRFEDILPDFYKFTSDAALVGHNIAFDFPFLIKHGNRCGYAFGNRVTFDTLGMAPKALPGIDILTLDNVLAKLGLVNDNAHRALSDATATAKAFIAMSKIIAKGAV